jgi:hypothetical protein
VTARRVFVALLAVLAALDVLILAIRVADVLTLGRLTLFPAEGPVLYAIWKVRNGHSLYEWPTRPYFTLTLYNFLFYESYAAIFTALRVANDQAAIAARLVTLVFAFAGAVAQYAAGRRFAPSGFRVPLALLSLVTWIGCVLPGWWALAIRPDVPAAAFATLGIVAALSAFKGLTPDSARAVERCQSSEPTQTLEAQPFDRLSTSPENTERVRPQSGAAALGRVRPGWRLVGAGLAFFLAWTFKQSQIALFAATCMYIVFWRRSFRELLLVAAPCVVGAAIALDVGGAVYRANVLDAPRLNPLIPYLSIYWYRSVALTDLLLWGMSVYAIVALARPGSVHGPLRAIADVPARSMKVFGADLTYPALAAIAAFAAGAVLLAKAGSALNHVLELNIAGSLACAAVLGSVWDTPKARKVCAAGALMLVPMIAFDIALLQNDRSRATTALLLKSWGTPLHLTTASAARQREQLESIVRDLPKPVFTDDELFAQPWHATGNRYPTVMLDHVFYDAARPKGLVGRGVEGLFADRYFASAVIPDSSAFVVSAIRAGYRLVRTVPQDGGEPLRILLRDR